METIAFIKNNTGYWLLGAEDEYWHPYSSLKANDEVISKIEVDRQTYDKIIFKLEARLIDLKAGLITEENFINFMHTLV